MPDQGDRREQRVGAEVGALPDGVVSKAPIEERKLVAIGENKLKFSGMQVLVWAVIAKGTESSLSTLPTRGCPLVPCSS